MYKRTLFIGFMLFALFFGAGNLIFPPSVGQLSGSNFVLAILGFVVTGVGLPLVGVIGGSFSEEGYRAEAKRVHPIFSLLFMITIYLTIGPFFAIPRTATVSYEMGILPFLAGGEQTTASITLFAGVYFLIVFFLALNPHKLVDRVGQILTPLLLVTIILLIVRSFMLLDTPITEASDSAYATTPFFKGFFEGYQTMDTIAAVAFAIIVLNAVKATGITNQKQIFKQASIAAVIAGVGLGAVYLSLGWIGNNYLLSEAEAAGGNMGASILTAVARLTYGEAGRMLLSGIVTLACLTTAIGLIVAISSYFNEILPILSYRIYAVIFTLISFVIASQGLNSIISGAVPVLMIIYPITIVLIALVFIDKALKGMPNLALQLPIYSTVIISVLSVVKSQLGEKSPLGGNLEAILSYLPFHGADMEWMVPAVVMFALGLGLGYLFKTKRD